MEFPMEFSKNRKIKNQLKSIEKKLNISKKFKKTVKNDLFSFEEFASM